MVENEARTSGVMNPASETVRQLRFGHILLTFIADRSRLGVRLFRSKITYFHSGPMQNSPTTFVFQSTQVPLC